MTATRKQIMSALCTRIFAIADFKTTGRRALLWSKLTLDKQPACFVQKVKESIEHPNTMLAIRRIYVDVVFYVQVGSNAEAEPDAAIDDLLDALEAALAPDDDLTNMQTLGGLVQQCWIEGDADIGKGGLDGQVVTIVPIQILAP